MDKINLSNVKVLHEDKWVSLYQTEKGFTFSHESFANGHKVGILPYRRINNDIEVLVIHEHNPAWNLNSKLGNEYQFITLITGSMENGNVLQTLQLELYEEGGYDISIDKIKIVGEKFTCKSNTSMYHLAIVDLTGVNQSYEPEGDNPGDKTEWIPLRKASFMSNDFLLSYLLDQVRLKFLFRDLTFFRDTL
jgi:8-oxo-dGTP pyrophosphatase MutT (NUDIX family)